MQQGKNLLDVFRQVHVLLIGQQGGYGDVIGASDLSRLHRQPAQSVGLIQRHNGYGAVFQQRGRSSPVSNPSRVLLPLCTASAAVALPLRATTV